ncbi:helix-turn-helix domain-containing protein [Gorillibacterium sp. CAU 1737]|uniref:helix-turn-helix domain-containing protein n=1 Tax=Gorillibacterium sp. CAU 1737 TaxID=3140362 RepID=UPI003261A5BB
MKLPFSKRLFQSRETIARRVFLCFLTITALFSLYYLTLMSLYHSSMEKQTDRANKAALQHAADQFAERLVQVQALLTELSQEADLIAWQDKAANTTDRVPESSVDQAAVNRIESDLQLAQAEVDDVWVLLPDPSLAMTSQGIFDARDLSERLYANETYTYDYWKRVIDEPGVWSILPTALFQTDDHSRMLLPVAYEVQESGSLIVALLDMDQIGEQLADTGIMGSLSIWDEGGTLLYQTVEGSDAIKPAEVPSNGYGKIDGRFVYRHIDSLGNTYLSTLSSRELYQEAYHAHRTAIALLAAAFVTALAAAIWFSLRLQAPVRALLASMHRMLPAPAKGKVREYRLMQNQLNEWYSLREHAEHQFQQQQSALLDYRYMSLLRGTAPEESTPLPHSPLEDRSFLLILYSLRLLSSMEAKNAEDKSLLTRQLLDTLQDRLSQRFSESRTFQMEHNQMISIVSDEERSNVLTMLQDELLADIHSERCGCIVTVSVSKCYSGANHYHEAYLEVLEINRTAPLTDESSLVSERHAPRPLRLTPRQEQELHAALRSGHTDNALRIADHALVQLARAQAGAAHYSELSIQLLGRFRTSFASQPHDEQEASRFAQLEAQLNQCREPAAHQEAIAALIRFLCDRRPHETINQDPVAALVLDILNTKYDQDLSLTKLADKLNMSSTYLSVYIKEKTGSTFSDHLNDIRLRKAMELLVCTDQSVTAVSKQVGYANFTSFNRMFKKQTGMSPSEYRKSQIMQIHGAR